MKNRIFTKKYLLCLILILILSYVLIYCIFKGDGYLSTGIDLEKKDWLAFLGSYLSMAATTILGISTIIQSENFKKLIKIEETTSE